MDELLYQGLVPAYVKTLVEKAPIYKSSSECCRGCGCTFGTHRWTPFVKIIISSFLSFLVWGFYCQAKRYEEEALDN